MATDDQIIKKFIYDIITADTGEGIDTCINNIDTILNYSIISDMEKDVYEVSQNILIVIYNFCKNNPVLLEQIIFEYKL